MPSAPPPPPIQGPTSSVPLNVGMGGGAFAASNAMTANFLGNDVNEVALGVNLVFQFLKFLPINQHFWWPIILVILGILAFYYLTQGDIYASVKHGSAAAFQAALNYHLFKLGGFNILPSAPD